MSAEESRVTREPSPGIPGISDSVRVSAGDLLFLSGVVGLRPGGEPARDLAEEIDLVFGELERALSARGATLASIVRVTVYIVGLTPERLSTYRAVRDRWIDPEHVPASTLVGVAALYSDAVTIEIDAIAAV
ncbi:Rid family hydrolase [Yonghaparkia sp. Root332]|uniref:Rid family hydrolase n=1 Tax=Yonghaparkia sp. Root332 TaxID=1736516 RepID=UPI000A64B681|nr:Rid family hydrolase [Yonghaparkia sp. Root332]